MLTSTLGGSPALVRAGKGAMPWAPKLARKPSGQEIWSFGGTPTIQDYDVMQHLDIYI